MSNFVIIPDSSCDLNQELRTRFSIPDYLRGVVTFPDGHSIKADLDWKDFTPESFYNSMKDRKSIIKTSTASIEEAVELFGKYLEEGKDVLSVSLSSALSGTYNVCIQAAKVLQEKYPDRKIICVDSLRYSTALSLLVVMACQLQKKGLSIEEVADWMEKNKHCIHQIGAMDDLFFLCKTGRISNFKAFFGTLVGVNPMADFNRQGLSEVILKVKGKQTAFDTAVEYMKQTIIEDKNEIIFVAHSNRENFALKMKDMIAEVFPNKEIILSDVGMSCGASIGPGLVATFFYGREISDNLESEKKLINEIYEKFNKK